MADCLNHVAGSRLALGPYHRGSLAYAPECLAQVARTADKRNLELSLVDMVHIVGRGENLALIYVVNLYGFKYLSLDKVSDTAFCHDRNRHCLLNTFNHLGVAHS